MKSFPNESVFNNLLDTEALLGVSSIMYHSTRHFQSLFFHFSFTSLKAPDLVLPGFSSLARTSRSVHRYLFYPVVTDRCVRVCVSAGLKLQVAPGFVSVHTYSRAQVPTLLPMSTRVRLSRVARLSHGCSHICL